MRKFLTVILTIFLAVTLVGCGSTNTDGPVKISLTLWDEVQAPVIQQMVDVFNEKNAGKIEASIELVPWSNYWTKLDASLESGEAADVMWMNVYLPKYVEGGVVAPLDDYISKGKVDLHDYVDARVNAFNYKGAQYALPKGLDAVYVAYNKELFDKAGVAYPAEGWTWEDMTATADALKAKLAASEYPIVMELDAQPSWMNFIHQDGGAFLSDDRMTTKINEPGSISAIEKVVSLMDHKQMAPYKVLSETKGTDLFISGKAAIVFVGSWKATVLENSSLGAAGKIGLVQMPAMSVDNHSVLGGLGYVMAANTKYPKQAFELIKFITSAESLANEAKNGIDFPANIAAQAAYVASFKNIDAQVIANATLTGFPYPSNGNFSWTGTVNDAIALIFAGKAPAKATLDKAAVEAQAKINEAFGR